MKSTHLDKTEQLVNNIEQYIAREQNYVRAKEESYRRQLAELEEPDTNTTNFSSGDYWSKKRSYEAQLNRNIATLDELSKEVAKNMALAKVSSGITNLIKGKSNHDYNHKRAPQMLEVHSVDECSMIVESLKVQVDMSTFSLEDFKDDLINPILGSSKKNKLRLWSDTIVNLRMTIQGNREELIQKSVEDELKQESIQAASRRLETERSRIENKFKSDMAGIQEKFKADLEEILPDKVIHELEDIQDGYGEDVPGQSDTTFFVKIPLDEMVKNNVLKQVIYNKCKNLIRDGYLRIPAPMTGENGEAAWLMFWEDTSIASNKIEIMNSVMFDILRKNSGGDLKITIIDPLNQRNRFAEFESLIETIPNLFDGETAVSPEEIKDTLRKISGTFSGNRLLVVTNFPDNFDEESLHLLNHLLQKEGEHIRAIFTAQTEFPGFENQAPGFRQNLQEILNHLEIIDKEIRWRGHALIWRWHGLEYLEEIAKHPGALNMRKKRPDIMSDFVSRTMQIYFTDNYEIQAEYNYRYLPEINNRITELLKKDGSFHGEMLLGKIGYPKSLFKTPKSYMNLARYHEMENIFAKVGIETDSSTVNFPWEVNLRECMNLYLKGTQKETEAMAAFTYDVIWNFLDSMPMAKLNICIFDSEQKGKSVLPFSDFRKRCPGIFGKKIYTNTDEMYEQLRALNEKMNDFIQKKSGKYKDFLEYNQNVKESSEAATLLVIYDFPGNMDQHILDELISIIQNGNACGIYTIICHNSDLHCMGHEQIDFCLKLIDANSINLECRNGNCYFAQTDVKVKPARRVLKERQAKFIQQYAEVENLISFQLELEERAEYNFVTHSSLIKDMITWNVARPGGFPYMIYLGNIRFPKELFKNPEKYTNMAGYHELKDTFEEFGIKADSSAIDFPWEVNLRKVMNLYLKGTQKETESMTAFANAVVWNFLDSMPVSKLNICVFDSEQKGNSFFPFLNFRKQCPEIFGKKIYTNTEEMYGQLRVLNEKINDFIQEKRGEYKDFLEYNENTPKRSEPATLLVIYDFPGNMDQRVLNELMSIIQNGNACGIYTIICHNLDLRYMGYEKIDSYLNRISENSITLECVDGKYYTAGNVLKGVEIRPAKRVLEDRQAEFIQQYVEQLKEISQQGIDFADILPEEAEMFQADSSECLAIPIGVGDGDQIVDLVMGENQSHHALVAGATGSGKSVLLHSIIMSSMLKYSPEELQLYLMDFKSGTEFAIYDRYRLPHIRLLALDAMQEFGESILEHLVKEMEERAEAFKEAGGLTKIRDYVELTDRTMPRILVVMDEFQILYNDASNRKVAMHCAELTKRLVTEGRAYGIHLLMATQSTKVLMNLALEAGTIEQMRIRIGLKCSEADSRYLFGDENCAKVLEMMKGETGTAVMSSDYTEDGVTGFRVAYSKPDQEEFLEIIADSMTDYPVNTQVFEGKRTEKLTDSLKAQDASMYEGMPLHIHYGIPIKVAPPYIVKMTKKPKNNLLICCGANPKMANMVSNNYMVSALMNQKTDVYCMDGNILLEDDYERDIYEVMDSCTGRFKMAEDRGDIIRMIDQLYDRYKEQRKKGKAEQAIVVVLKNLEFLDIVCDMLKGDRVLREDYLDEIDNIADASASELSDVEKAFGGNDLFGFLPTPNGSSQTSAKPDLGDELLELLDRGAAYGIYFVVSTLDYQTVRETMVMGRNYEDTLKKFPNRIICGLQDNDAQALIPDVTLSGMENNTVYYTDGLRQKFQLKPFIAPGAEELEKLLTK